MKDSLEFRRPGIESVSTTAKTGRQKRKNGDEAKTGTNAKTGTGLTEAKAGT